MIFPCEDVGGYRKFGYVRKGTGEIHCGHDSNTLNNKIVKYICDGVVLYSGLAAGFGSYGSSGWVVIVLHKWKDEEFVCLYGHVDTLVKKDDKVKEGQLLGEVSEYWLKYKNRDCRADHLHWFINKGNKIPKGKWGYRKSLKGFTDPIKFVEERRV
jgi:murein DD-endopeptidase MepM/ murein hydrolase activator NlpD